MTSKINLDIMMEVANNTVAEIKVWKVSYWTTGGQYWQCEVYVGADDADSAVKAANAYIGQIRNDAVVQVPFWSRAHGVIMVNEFEN
jgi:hypothetical protein